MLLGFIPSAYVYLHDKVTNSFVENALVWELAKAVNIINGKNSCELCDSSVWLYIIIVFLMQLRSNQKTSEDNFFVECRKFEYLNKYYSNYLFYGTCNPSVCV